MIRRAVARGDLPAPAGIDHAVAQLVGPLFFQIISGSARPVVGPRELAGAFLRALDDRPAAERA